ncbi:MAG: hypothetical protein D6812_13420 [Deltaproteobacteria bacterium]|nr:MAG: hypothetical protein D6812_13420 [Deltaproteobacteria bacterium]
MIFRPVTWMKHFQKVSHSGHDIRSFPMGEKGKVHTGKRLQDGIPSFPPMIPPSNGIHLPLEDTRNLSPPPEFQRWDRNP